MTHSNEPHNGLTPEFFNSFISSTVKTYNQATVSMSSDGDCVYKGLHQTCCIIGHSITDEHYSPSMDIEAMSSGDSMIVTALEKSVGAKMNEHDNVLALRLQVLHDNLAKFKGDEFKEKLLARLEKNDISKEYPEFVVAVKLAIGKGA